jgi:hypothetical protein
VVQGVTNGGQLDGLGLGRLGNSQELPGHSVRGLVEPALSRGLALRCRAAVPETDPLALRRPGAARLAVVLAVRLAAPRMVERSASEAIGRPSDGSAAQFGVIVPHFTERITKTNRLSLPRTDGRGFVESYARCDPGNPRALMAQTTESLVVVCQALRRGMSIV